MAPGRRPALPTSLSMARLLPWLFTHALAAGAGFVLGIYLLPVLTAPDAPSAAVLQSASAAAVYQAEFRRDLPGSDLLHWGEGTVMVGPRQIAMRGRLAPGPDYKLYLTPRLVTTEAEFLAVKRASRQIGDVRNFENFVVAVPEPVNIEDYSGVLVWCESFGQFITAAQYR